MKNNFKIIILVGLALLALIIDLLVVGRSFWQIAQKPKTDSSATFSQNELIQFKKVIEFLNSRQALDK